ncbi:NAD-binding protein [Cyathus striatus]|nr:NAD-binding protein [Cyathus striatus]
MQRHTIRSTFLPRTAKPLSGNIPRHRTPIRPILSLPQNRTISSTATNRDKLTLPYRIESILAPLGVAAAVAHSKGDESIPPKPKIFQEFSLTDRVALVSGANQGLGLEMALALVEAGARAVYCVDLNEPSEEWNATRKWVDLMREKGEIKGRLEYRQGDVTDQMGMWKIGEEIGDLEGRMDVGVAAAGIPSTHTDCLDYPAEHLRKVLDVNTSGALFTAQAVGRQMQRFNTTGSIILIASMSGSITNKGHKWVSYNSSKAAVIQMARNMACELGPRGIRVNSLSPGYIFTNMSAAELETKPQLLDKWSELTPLKRIGRPDELRGVVTWLASDASSFCTGSDIIVSGGHTSW